MSVVTCLCNPIKIMTEKHPDTPTVSFTEGTP